MATVVVCDDDPVLRKTVSSLCDEVGLDVVAETDSGTDAVELVSRFGIDIVVLDLSLTDGSGEIRLEALQRLVPAPKVIIFTAYASDANRLRRLGALDVIEKPDMEGLATALRRLVTAEAPTAPAAAGAEERRRSSRPVEPVPALWRSPSGIGSSRDLIHVLGKTVAGDSLLVVLMDDLDRVEAAVGPLLGADCRLQPARLLAQTVRADDTVHEVPDLQGFVAVLRGGDESTATAVWRRLLAAFGESGAPGQVRGAHTIVDDVGGAGALARAIGAVTAAGPLAGALVGA